MNMAQFKKLKAIPSAPKFTVFGYGRSIEKHSTILNIPVMIHYLILGYYYHGEYFEKSGKELIISEGKMSVQRSEVSEWSRYKRNAYCKTWIKSNIKQIVT